MGVVQRKSSLIVVYVLLAFTAAIAIPALVISCIAFTQENHSGEATLSLFYINSTNMIDTTNVDLSTTSLGFYCSHIHFPKHSISSCRFTGLLTVEDCGTEMSFVVHVPYLIPFVPNIPVAITSVPLIAEPAQTTFVQTVLVLVVSANQTHSVMYVQTLNTGNCNGTRFGLITSGVLPLITNAN